MSSVGTAGFEPATPWPPGRRAKSYPSSELVFRAGVLLADVRFVWCVPRRVVPRWSPGCFPGLDDRQYRFGRSNASASTASVVWGVRDTWRCCSTAGRLAVNDHLTVGTCRELTCECQQWVKQIQARPVSRRIFDSYQGPPNPRLLFRICVAIWIAKRASVRSILFRTFSYSGSGLVLNNPIARC